MKRLSVLVPVYYNEGTLEALHERLLTLQENLDGETSLEFVFVDDGSGDGSREVLRNLAEKDPGRVRLVFLSRNFGSFNALLAGLQYVTGDCVAIISADLQDPPEIIATMFEQWLQGNQTVMAVRKERRDPFLTTLFSKASYAILRKIALPNFPKGGFDFVLIDKKIKDIIIDMGERNTSLMGLIVWMGFRQAEIHYTRQPRAAGRSKWTFWKKVKYFIDSILAFSYAPMRIMSSIGFILGFLGLCYAAFLIIQRMTYGITVPGWTALMVAILVLFGFQFVSMGVIGEYIWRMLDEVRRRPAFIVDEVIGAESEGRQDN